MASFAWKAAARLPSESDSIKRVMPQPGQSSPVMTRQAESRRAAEDEIGDADGEEQDVASENDLGACSLLGGKPSCHSFCIACDVFCGKKKPPENGRLLSFRIVHDLEGL